MTTSRRTPFLSEILDGDVIPSSKFFYFRQRFIHHLYDVVVGEFVEQQKKGLTIADIARRANRQPGQIAHWLQMPDNWTLETASDLMLVIAKAEPKVEIASLESLPKDDPHNRKRPLPESERGDIRVEAP